MIILIDGYNILKQYLRKTLINENEINQFVGQLNLYAEKTGHKICLVFDSGPLDYVLRKKIKKIDVIYSGQLQTADEYIKKYILNTENKDRILLVTSDAELLEFADALKITSVGSLDFYNIILNSLNKKDYTVISSDQEAKIFHESGFDIDQLMEEGSKKILIKNEDISAIYKKQGSGKQLSKAEKQMMKVLKKL